MSKSYEIPRKMGNYLRRIASEYNSGNLAHIGIVIEGSKFLVREETDYDYFSGQVGHDLIFFVPDHLMRNIPLDDEGEIRNRLERDLNIAASSVDDEYVANVRFKYLDEAEEEVNSVSDQEHLYEEYERLWSPGCIRLFISHRDTAKGQVDELASKLLNHEISSFVAHDAIEPDEDWQKEIEKALKTMNAMLAFITDDFFQSPWTNQEIGYALAHNVPIISIKMGKQDPIGFIRNRQAIRGDINNVASDAIEIKRILKKRLFGSPSYREWMLNQFINAGSFKKAGETFEELKPLNNITAREIALLVNAYNTNSQLNSCFKLTEQNRFLNWVNEFGFEKYVMDGSRIRPS